MIRRFIRYSIATFVSALLAYASFYYYLSHQDDAFARYVGLFFIIVFFVVFTMFIGVIFDPKNFK